ncbi:MAG: hypothetical protein ACK4OM_07790 [Alphaproteobacteria bacterium]
MHKYQLVTEIDWEEEQTDRTPNITPENSNDLYQDWPSWPEIPKIKYDSNLIYCSSSNF